MRTGWVQLGLTSARDAKFACTAKKRPVNAGLGMVCGGDHVVRAGPDAGTHRPAGAATGGDADVRAGGGGHSGSGGAAQAGE